MEETKCGVDENSGEDDKRDAVALISLHTAKHGLAATGQNAHPGLSRSDQRWNAHYGCTRRLTEGTPKCRQLDNRTAQARLNLYFQTPFGKLHKTNPEIVGLARLIRRTPSALAMKLVNFASLDSSITHSGRKGLSGASALDRKIWKKFHTDWEGLALECEELRQQLDHGQAFSSSGERNEPEDDLTDLTGETRLALVRQRIKQDFFRRTVLASYRNRCCISGVSEPRLLVASQIVPWGQDKANRLNPRNGLCLSAIHDKAFDNHLFTLSEDWRVILSAQLKASRDSFVQEVFFPAEGTQIELPDRLRPDQSLVAAHRQRTLQDA